MVKLVLKVSDSYSLPKPKYKNWLNSISYRFNIWASKASIWKSKRNWELLDSYVVSISRKTVKCITRFNSRSTKYRVRWILRM